MRQRVHIVVAHADVLLGLRGEGYHLGAQLLDAAHGVLRHEASAEVELIVALAREACQIGRAGLLQRIALVGVSLVVVGLVVVVVVALVVVVVVVGFAVVVVVVVVVVEVVVDVVEVVTIGFLGSKFVLEMTG